VREGARARRGRRVGSPSRFERVEVFCSRGLGGGPIYCEDVEGEWCVGEGAGEVGLGMKEEEKEEGGALARRSFLPSSLARKWEGAKKERMGRREEERKIGDLEDAPDPIPHQ
jgi:hypothetical protein